MAVPVIMPRHGNSVESCVITEWHKRVGDTVKAGDSLFTYETDKAIFTEESTVDGTLLAVFFNKGDEAPCLANVAVIGSPEESFDQFAPETGKKIEKEISMTAQPEAVISVDEKAGPLFTDNNFAISPRARETAKKMKLDPAQASPTGPHGRVIERDIIDLARIERNIDSKILTTVGAETVRSGNFLSGTEFEDEELSNTRKIIAKTMHHSLSTMAQLTNNISFDATNILAFRKQLKAAAEKMDIPDMTINDIILCAVSRVLKNHRDLNAHFLDNKIRRFKPVHLGVAVDTPRGLMVPTLFYADTKSIKEISVQAKALADACKKGDISPDLLSGGTFTVSNLGALGIESFTPVINPPQTGILGVNGIVERVRTVDGTITTYPAMGLSLTYDHRAIDGAPASRFLAELKDSLENILSLLVY